MEQDDEGERGLNHGYKNEGNHMFLIGLWGYNVYFFAEVMMIT